jgi:ATP-dependent helicase/nuclease subunit A
MTMKKWTPEQEAAIASRHENLLVSAAAGSGKTALLIERIRRLIVEDGVSVDSLLVLTFTRAAAGEMRERLSTALTKALAAAPDPHTRKRLSGELQKLPSAAIKTIDAFCGEVVREYFQEVGADPNYRVGDKTELAMLQNEALAAVFEKHYQAVPEDGRTPFSDLVDRYGTSRSDEGLRELVLATRFFLTSLKDPAAWQQTAIEQLTMDAPAFEASSWRKAVNAMAASALTAAVRLLDTARAILDGVSDFEETQAQLDGDRAMVAQARSAVDGDWESFRAALRGVDFRTYKGNRKADAVLSDSVRDLRKEAKQIIKEVQALISGDLKTQLADHRAMAAPMQALLDLTADFEAAYRRLKAERDVVDFNDVERDTLAILANDAIAETLQQRFAHIFVDEYQDTNEVQEAILARVRRPDNYFMVGDVKQSIYRFRLADPTIFIDKYRQYQSGQAPASKLVTLGRNFRSDQGVVDGVNALFARIMSPALGEVAYDDNAALVCGLADEARPLLPVSVEVLEGPTAEKAEAEARHIAGLIHQWVGQEIFIAKEGEERPLRYRDIGVLMRSVSGKGNRGETMARVLADEGIPTYLEGGATYYAAIEVSVVLNLIRVIDNYRQDLPLLSVMRSPAGRFSDEELAAIRVAAKERPFYQSLEAMAETASPLGEKAAGFLARLARWREQSFTMSVSDFLWQLYLETGYYTAVGALPGGEQRQKNLRTLLTRAETYQANTLKGVFPFVDYVERMDKASFDDSPPGVLSENDDVVRIMTIHKSKGLEFPAVILAGAGNQFNIKDTGGKVLLHRKLGICPEWINPEAGARHNTLARALAQAQIKSETLSEEMRLLYVAMTRAMEKLVIVGTVKDVDAAAKKWQRPCEPYFLEKAKSSFLDWIMLALYDPGWPGNSVTPAVTIALDVGETGEPLHSQAAAQKPAETDAAALQAEVARRLAWHYPAPRAQAPSKLSVTEIERLREQQDPAEGRIEIPERITRPAFMAEAGPRHWLPSELGTGIHTLLQRIDLDKVRACGGDAAQIAAVVRAEAGRLAELGILEAELVKALDLRPVVWLMGSPVGKRLLRADTCRRELPFNLAVPGRRINPAYGEETVLLQGMIDGCFIEDDRWILLDYKTDRWHSREGRDRLIARYQMQIDFYEQALAAITGRPVAEKYLLFIAMGEAVKLPPAEKIF